MRPTTTTRGMLNVVPVDRKLVLTKVLFTVNLYNIVMQHGFLFVLVDLRVVVGTTTLTFIITNDH